MEILTINWKGKGSSEKRFVFKSQSDRSMVFLAEVTDDMIQDLFALLKMTDIFLFLSYWFYITTTDGSGAE